MPLRSLFASSSSAPPSPTTVKPVKPSKLTKKPSSRAVEQHVQRQRDEERRAAQREEMRAHALALRLSLTARPTTPPASTRPGAVDTSDEEAEGPVPPPKDSCIPEPSQTLLTEHYLHLATDELEETRSEEEEEQQPESVTMEQLMQLREAERRMRSALNVLLAHEAPPPVTLPVLPRRSESMPTTPTSPSFLRNTFLPRPPIRSQSVVQASTSALPASEPLVDEGILRQVVLSDITLAETDLLDTLHAVARGGKATSYPERNKQVWRIARWILVNHGFTVHSAEWQALHAATEAFCDATRRARQAITSGMNLAESLANWSEAYCVYAPLLHSYERNAPNRRKQDARTAKAQHMLAAAAFRTSEDDDPRLGEIMSTAEILATTIQGALQQEWLSKDEVADLDPRVFVAMPRLAVLYGVRDAVWPAAWQRSGLEAIDEERLFIFLPKICKAALKKADIVAIVNMDTTMTKQLARLLVGSQWPGYFPMPELEALYRSVAALVDSMVYKDKKKWNARLGRALAKWASEQEDF